jgi:Tol biopolymer transport system component
MGPRAFSPDRTQLLVSEGTGESRGIHLVELESGRTPRPLLATSFNEFNPEVSPDGRWLAYESNESGRVEVYVRPFPDRRPLRSHAKRYHATTRGGWCQPTGFDHLRTHSREAGVQK